MVCPIGYKHCFTTAYVSKQGKLIVVEQGCWRKSEAEEGQCVRKGCLFGQRPEVDIEDRRTCCCTGIACNRNSTYVDRILHVRKISTTQRTTSSEIPGKIVYVSFHIQLSNFSTKGLVINSSLGKEGDSKFTYSQRG